MGVSKTQQLRFHQWAPADVEDVWSFFASETNLEEITPPWLRFRVVGKSSPQMEEGTTIDYRLRIRGIPVAWRSEICLWEPPRAFAGRQLKGPYRYWYHVHRFTPEAGGTAIEDEVDFQLPLPFLSSWIVGPWVRRDVERIFEFRRQRIAERFGEARRERGE